MKAGVARHLILTLGPRRQDRRLLAVEALLLAGLLIGWIAVSRTALGSVDIAIWLMAATPLALSAMTQTMPVLAGGQGLAAGSTALLVNAMVATAPIANGTDALLWILLGIAAGGAIGALNGILIGAVRLPSTAVTFATSVAVASLAQYLAANADMAPDAPPILQDALAQGSWGLPVLLIVVVCLAGLALQRSALGRGLSAIGRRPTLAQRLALPTARWRILAYIVAGLGYGATGVFLAAQVGAIDMVMGAPLLLQIYAAVALGGGVPGLRAGSVLGSLLGALIVSATGNLLLPVGLDDYLGTGFDAIWLLLGVALCILLVRRHPGSAIAPPPTISSPVSPNGLPLLAVGFASILLLALTQPGNRDLLTISALLPLLVIGQGAVLRAGGFDLAMPALIAFAGMTVVTLTQGLNERLPLSLLAILILALAIGWLQGTLAPRLHRGIVVLSLAVGGLLLTAADALVVESPTGFSPPALTMLATTRWLGLPPIVWLAVPLFLALGRAVDRYGRRWRRGAYILSALTAALFGLMMAGFAGQYKIGFADTYLTPTLVAATLGGISFLGGRGSILSAVGASLLITTIDSLLIALGLPFEFRLIGFAALLLAAVAWQQRGATIFGLQGLLPTARRTRS
ncbi:ABC transporter permease [Hypericibacter sp.]|uniref:ABC transporter permease n=1 Tax=Hypericibacter sp. TaxID=2705401 RepID=UPI003D6DA661